MKTWEYLTVSLDSTGLSAAGVATQAEALNKLGAAGWEVVSMAGSEVHLKRDATPPECIDVFLVTDPPHEAFPMGIQIIAVDGSRERWTVVEAGRGARCNKYGAWWVAGKALTEDFVFTLDGAKAMVARAVKEAEELIASEVEAARRAPAAEPS